MQATDINDAGQIVAIGYNNLLGQTRAVRLDPLLPRGTSTPLGSGCGAAPAAPTLSSSLPVLGQPFTMNLIGFTPFAMGNVYASLTSPAAVPLGSGCTVFVDLATFIPVFPVAADALGIATVATGLPLDPSLASIAVTMQAAMGPSSTSLGLDLSQGLLLVLGF